MVSLWQFKVREEVLYREKTGGKIRRMKEVRVGFSGEDRRYGGCESRV